MLSLKPHTHSPGAGAAKDRGLAQGLGSLHSGKLMHACSPGEGRVRGPGCLRPGRWTGAEEERPRGLGYVDPSAARELAAPSADSNPNGGPLQENTVPEKKFKSLEIQFLFIS